MIQRERHGPMARGAPNMSKNYPHMQRGSTAQGELEGAKPASNPIECPAKPCCARRAAHKVGTFTLRSSGKVMAFYMISSASILTKSIPSTTKIMARMRLPPPRMAHKAPQ